jgi:hypothetical protein
MAASVVNDIANTPPTTMIAQTTGSAALEIAKVGRMNLTASDRETDVSLTCPKCRKHGVFYRYHGLSDLTWETKLDQLMPATRRTIGIRLCPDMECDTFVFVVLENKRLNTTYPPQVLDFDSTNLPATIVASLEEAVRCHSAGCYRASALMVRRVLEELCDDKDARGANLLQKIKALQSVVVLPQELLDAADELRLLGNDAAHIEAKTYDAIEAEEIEVALELAKELLKAVYQYTNLVDRLRALKK